MIEDVDILIIGGGLIGLTLLLGLQKQGFNVCLVDSKIQKQSISATEVFDVRSLALSPASVEILKQLHCWSEINSFTTPIDVIEVSEQKRFAKAYLRATESEPLGYVIELPNLLANIAAQVDQSAIRTAVCVTHYCPQKKQVTIQSNQHSESENITYLMRAKLIISAEGTQSVMRDCCGLSAESKKYPAQALVTNIGLKNDHANQAYERFTQYGPMAFLPLSQQRMALVWALEPSKAQYYQNVCEKKFLSELQRNFGYRLGRFVRVGERVIFPLMHLFMPKIVKNNVVFVGNAANTLHPVAGQGFNLGLRDVASLIHCIRTQGIATPAATEAMLLNYQILRQNDHAMVSYGTDNLIRLFTSKIPGVACLRSLGLFGFDHMELGKKILIHYASGAAGAVNE